jgi:hypothetical protein
MILPIAMVSAGALVGWTIAWNISRRRRERQVLNERRAQTATDFALLFDTPTQRHVAEKLFRYLQMGTFTRQFSFRAEDHLWHSPLRFVQDDLEDNLRLGFWDELDLGLTSETSDFATSLLSSVETVGDLVNRIVTIYEDRYGTVESRQP